MMYPKLAALAVVLHQKRVLLVRRKKEPDAGLWGFPGGQVEPGETALAAATRELAEETGVTATPLHYLTNVDVIARGKDGALDYHFLLAAVLCRYRNGTPQPADDVSDARWIEFGRISNFETSAGVTEIVKLAADESSFEN